jgi:hypothetical protein
MDDAMISYIHTMNIQTYTYTLPTSMKQIDNIR